MTIMPPTSAVSPNLSKLRFYSIRFASIAVLLLAMALGVYFYLQSATSHDLYTGAIEKVRIGNVGEHTIFNLIAQDRGYFSEQGLDTNITEYPSGPASMAALLDGKEDISIAAEFVGVRNIFTNPDIRILAQVNSNRVFQVAVRAADIAAPTDLAGKRIGVTQNSAGEYFLGALLVANNVELSSVTLVNQTPAEMLQGIEDGTVDAVVLFDPYIYNLKKKQGDAIRLFDLQYKQYNNALAYSTQRYLDAHPTVAVRYLRALVEAEQYYHTHTAEAQVLVAQKLGLDPEYQGYVKSKVTNELALDQALIINMESEARWSIQKKLTDQTVVPNYLSYIYGDALQTVKPDSISLIR